MINPLLHLGIVRLREPPGSGSLLRDELAGSGEGDKLGRIPGMEPKHLWPQALW